MRGELAAAIERLRPTSRDVAWVSPGNLHLTVKFLGNVAPERIDAVVAVLTDAVAGLGVFDAAIRGLGAFPSLARPRVIWAGVTVGTGAMVEVARRVDEALAAVGFSREARPFSPHVTLGRVRRPGPNSTLANALRAEEAREFGQIRVGGVRLMRSELSPHGARYSELAAAALRGHAERRV